MGYSTGKWKGDSLVVDIAGFNDQFRLDAIGHPNSEELRVREVFRRRDFGHLDIDATVEDPVVLTRPVNVKFSLQLIPNSDILENFCAEASGISSSRADRSNSSVPQTHEETALAPVGRSLGKNGSTASSRSPFPPTQKPRSAVGRGTA
jgi:hypothetical protein